MDRFHTPRKFNKLFIGTNVRRNCVRSCYDAKMRKVLLLFFKFTISRGIKLKQDTKPNELYAIKAAQTDCYRVSKGATPNQTL